MGQPKARSQSATSFLFPASIRIRVCPSTSTLQVAMFNKPPTWKTLLPVPLRGKMRLMEAFTADADKFPPKQKNWVTYYSWATSRTDGCKRKGIAIETNPHRLGVVSPSVAWSYKPYNSFQQAYQTSETYTNDPGAICSHRIRGMPDRALGCLRNCAWSRIELSMVTRNSTDRAPSSLPSPHPLSFRQSRYRGDVVSPPSHTAAAPHGVSPPPQAAAASPPFASEDHLVILITETHPIHLDLFVIVRQHAAPFHYIWKPLTVSG